MKGLVYHGNEVLKWEEVQDVTPDDNEVKIKVKAAGICGSDVHGYQGITGRRIPPMIMGHEFSGVVSDVGKSVKKLTPGDRVTAYPMDFCGTCLSCRHGKMQFCPDKKQFGVLSVNGAFAEYLCVPEKVCYKLHDNISYSAGSMVEPLAVAFRGVEHAGDIEGKTILVVGSGTIGLMITACAKAKHPAKIIVTDLSDTRLNVAKRMGAEITINPSNSEVKEVIMDNTEGQGVDISFEAVGNTPACVQSLETLKVGGTSIWLGQGKKTVEIGMLDIVTRELNVSGSFTYGLDDFKAAVEMLNNGRIDPEPVISEEVPMGQAAQWFEKLKRPEELVKVILKEEE
jgi:L-iditol 2-dehydrogenase